MEDQGGTIDAVSEISFLRAVIKHVTKMAGTSARADRTSTGPDPEWNFISDFSSLAPTTSVLTLPVTAIVNILPPLSDPLVVRGLATDRAGGC